MRPSTTQTSPGVRATWVALLAFGACAPTVRACTCEEAPAYVAIARADAVFEGRVVRVERPTGSGKVRALGDDLQVVFDPARVWKGDVEGEVVVGTPASGAACGYTFQESASYVVCARREGETLVTGLCSGTARSDRATTLLRALSRLEAQGGAGMNEEAMALPILDALKHGDDEERADAASSLARLDIDPRPLMSSLTPLAEGDDPVARAAAVSAISSAETRVIRGLGGVSPVPPLVDTSFYVRALTDSDDRVRLAACRALTREHHARHAAGSEIAVDALIDASSSPNRELRELAVRVVATMETPPEKTERLLVDALGSPSSETRRAGSRGLSRMGPRGVVRLQGEVLADTDDRELARDVTRVLADAAHASDVAFSSLGALVLSGHPATRADAIMFLADARPGTPVVHALAEAAARDTSAVVRAGAVSALGRVNADSRWVVTLLAEAVNDDAAIVRLAAVRVLGRMGSGAARAVPALRARLAKAEGREAAQLRAAILRIDPEVDLSEAPGRR